MNWPEEEKITGGSADERSKLLAAFHEYVLQEAWITPIRQVSAALMYKQPGDITAWMEGFWVVPVPKKEDTDGTPDGVAG